MTFSSVSWLMEACLWRAALATAASARRAPEDAYRSQETSPISEKFTIVAAFGNVHGVHKVLGEDIGARWVTFALRLTLWILRV